MRSIGFAVLALFTLVCPSAWAELGVVVSEAGDHRLVLAQTPDAVQAELVGIGEGDAPLFDVVDCATLGSRMMDTARSEALRMDVMIARYNIVKVWTGNLCNGVTDVAPSADEARAWLTELAGLRRVEDGRPFIDARQLLAEVLVFGAPGVAPDYAQARAVLAQEVEADAEALLYLAYMAERGLGGGADSALALRYLRSAADRGNASADALLAQASELGLGVERNEAAALIGYERIAQAIFPPVWFRLGVMYLEGRGTDQQACRARDLLERAAGHAWSPVPAARAYLDRIRGERLCAARSP